MTVGSEAPCRGGASLPLNIWFGVAHSGAHGAAWRAAGMGGLRSTTRPPPRVPGPTGARRGPVVAPSSTTTAIPARAATPAIARGEDRRLRNAYHPHHAYHWWPRDRKIPLYREKGENAFPTAHERQNDYHRNHAYQLATESVRLGGEETRSDPYHVWVCGKQTFGPCTDLFWTSCRDDRKCAYSHTLP